MNCDRFRKQLGESGPREIAPEALTHMSKCAGCAALLQSQRRLEADLKQMAATQAGWSAPPRVEAALIHHFRTQVGQQHVSTRPVPGLPFWMRFRFPSLAAAGALAAALTLLLISRMPHPSHAVVSATTSQAAETDDYSAVDNGFVPLPYFRNSGDIADTAEADVVRVEMPRSTLVTLGIPVNDDSSSGTVEAELLLGEGGVPQAVRVLE